MPEDRKPKPERLRILIAEDERNIADLLVELLAKNDRDISIVHDGLDAVRRLHEGLFDLLITDLMMPRTDGMEVLHRARKLYPQILVIIITGYASLETAIQAVKEGAYDYLRKPFRLDELKISVDNACERIYLMRENKLLVEHLRQAYGSSGDTPKQQHNNSTGSASLAPSYLSAQRVPPSYFEPQGSSASSALTELERLGSLRRQGLIDEEEFTALKKRLLQRLG